MTIINAKIDDDIVKEFRDVVYRKYGLRKGDIKTAFEEALVDYIKKNRKDGND